MNFDFSDEQKLIQSEARKFLRERCSNDLVRKVMDDDEVYFDENLWQQIIELGWTGIAIPEQYDGLGMGYLELCVLAQEIGYSLAPVPFSSSIYLASEALKLFANEQQKSRWLSKIARGESIACLALSEQLGQSVTHNAQCTVSGNKLHGEKQAVVDGHIANMAIVSAADERGDNHLYLVELNQSAVTHHATKTLDPSRPQCTLRFDGAVVEVMGQLDGEGGGAQKQLAQLYSRAAVLFAFEQIGGCDAALKMGLKYTNERFAFGRPVASFQAIKHKFADMYVAKELATANAYYAAWALSTDAPELELAAATARVSAIEAYFLCSKENLQAHGGMGYTWEFDCHLHYRRAQHLSLNIGSSNYWKNQLADQLLLAEA